MLDDAATYVLLKHAETPFPEPVDTVVLVSTKRDVLCGRRSIFKYIQEIASLASRMESEIDLGIRVKNGDLLAFAMPACGESILGSKEDGLMGIWERFNRSGRF